MCSDPERHPILCIIPPHMLEVIALRGDAELRAFAREQLALAAEIRKERTAGASGGMSPDPDRQGAFVTTALARPAGRRKHTLARKIYDGKNAAKLPGTLLRSEGDPPSGDADADRAYDGAGEVFALYSREYRRDSLDDAGMTLESTVHHRRNYNNAFWNGSRMAYGDGDGVIFTTFTELSVIGHEMSHGVVQHSGGLLYDGQAGALNESYADVFGALTVQRSRRQEAHEADWLIGQGILGPGINGVALRSMKAPGTAYSDALLGQDPQPYHMDLYVATSADNGGVHINSGIPNHAFYLYATLLGGYAWEKPGGVWYRALQKINNPMATFNDWAAETMDAAIHRHGAGSWEMVILRRAWKLVGIDV